MPGICVLMGLQVFCLLWHKDEALLWQQGCELQSVPLSCMLYSLTSSNLSCIHEAATAVCVYVLWLDKSTILSRINKIEVKAITPSCRHMYLHVVTALVGFYFSRYGDHCGDWRLYWCVSSDFLLVELLTKVLPCLKVQKCHGYM